VKKVTVVIPCYNEEEGIAAVIKATDNATLGKILVDANGKTVYTLTNGGAAVACTGGCLSVWPPVMLPSGSSTATGGAGVSGLTVVTTSASTGASGAAVTEAQ